MRQLVKYLNSLLIMMLCIFSLTSLGQSGSACLRAFNRQAPLSKICCSQRYKSNVINCLPYPAIFSYKRNPLWDNTYSSDISYADKGIGSGPLKLTTICQVGPKHYKQIIIDCNNLLKNPNKYTKDKIKLTAKERQQGTRCLNLFNMKTPARKACCSTEHSVFNDCDNLPVILQTVDVSYDLDNYPNYDSNSPPIPPVKYIKHTYLRSMCQEVNQDNGQLHPYVARLGNIDCANILKKPEKITVDFDGKMTPGGQIGHWKLVPMKK